MDVVNSLHLLSCQERVNFERPHRTGQGLQDWRKIEVNVHDPFFGGPTIFTGLPPLREQCRAEAATSVACLC